MAVKVLRARDARAQEAFLHEMRILKALHHTNIVQFLGGCLLQHNVALVTEFLPEGDLWHAIACDYDRSLSFYNRSVLPHRPAWISPILTPVSSSAMLVYRRCFTHWCMTWLCDL